MNNQMSEVIKLAADSLSTLKQTFIKASILIIMNMIAEINEAAHSECISKLSNTLSEI